MSDLEATIQQAKGSYLRAKSHLCAAFASIPDDRVNWSPSSTARTPIEIVAHCAASVKFINQQMNGTPFPPPTPSAADAYFREWERQFESREQVLKALEEVSESYLTWLDDLTAERLESTPAGPFGLGEVPLVAWLGFAPDHTRGHASQLEYIQTIYGDRDWHLV